MLGLTPLIADTSSNLLAARNQMGATLGFHIVLACFGVAFGIGFAIEGIFFFLEAIFIAIYIYGWKRMPGWAHFWSGIPIAISGIGGAFSVVAANSWMNTPGGIT